MRENNRAARAARTILEYFDAVCQANDKVKVLTPNSNLLFSSTNPVLAQFVNNTECEQKAIIVK